MSDIREALEQAALEAMKEVLLGGSISDSAYSPEAIAAHVVDAILNEARARGYTLSHTGRGE